MKKIFLLLTLAMLLAACSSKPVREVRQDVDFSLTQQTTVYIDEWVRLSGVQVFISPTGPAVSPPTAVFMPFRMTQQMENARSIGYNISRIIWQTFLKEGALPTIEFADNAHAYRPDLAIAYARARNADLAIGGTINYFVDGGTVGDSSASVTIDIYDVKTGNLMWSMGQSGIMQHSTVNDYLLFAVKHRLPSDPASACIVGATTDLARIVQAWAYNIRPKEKSLFNFQPSAF